MTELLKRSGYTEKNLYKKENRVPIKVIKIYYQNIINGNRWIGTKKDIIIYVTKMYAEHIPENIVLAISRQGERYIFGKKEDILGELKKNLLCSKGPLYADKTIPHIIFEHELRGGLANIYE